MYVYTVEWYEDVYGVFSTRARAEAYLEKYQDEMLGENPYIVEYEVDKGVFLF